MATVGPFDFHGGFSPGHGFMTLPQGRGYASEMRNVRFTNGYVAPRWSQTQTNASTLGSGKYVTGLQAWRDIPNSVTTLVAVCDAKIWTSADVAAYIPSDSALTFTDRTGAVSVSNSGGVRYCFDALNTMLIGVGNSANGGVPFKVTAHNANAANLGGSPPAGDAVKQVNNFLFIGRQIGSSTTQSTVSWSNVADPETWTAANYVEFNKHDGEPVMALGSIGTDLYIFKQTSIGRLSTYSQIISGSVALGPLETVIKGIGCAGPLAIDNLPNGNIVFLGYDGHLYEFNGSTLSDISKSPFPGPNAYDCGESFGINGLSIGDVNTSSVVKVWRGINEVWVGFDSSNDSTGTRFNTFAYDFENRIWQGYVTDTNPKSMAVVAPTNANINFIESSNILFHGNADGKVFGHGSFLKQYPVNESGTAVEARIGTTIQIQKDFSDFVPRSVCFETSLSDATALAGVSLFVAFDTYTIGGLGAVLTKSGAVANRLFANIPMRQDSVGSNVLPSFITLHWVFTFSGSNGAVPIRLGKFYLSNEVVR